MAKKEYVVAKGHTLNYKSALDGKKAAVVEAKEGETVEVDEDDAVRLLKSGTIKTKSDAAKDAKAEAAAAAARGEGVEPDPEPAQTVVGEGELPGDKTPGATASSKTSRK